jgi:hypothetical protein
MTLSQLNSQNLVGVDADVVVQALTQRQFVRPHQPLRQALAEVIDELRCCPVAVERAVQWLQLQWDEPIGRLRRTELIQLARVIHRFWNESEAERQQQQKSQHPPVSHESASAPAQPT